MDQPDSSRRFESRADDYAASRPTYPAALVDHLVGRLGLRAGAEVADIGSGTGIFTRLLLERGLRVRAVEPGEAMRRTAEALLGAWPGFVSVAGTAQATGLPARSVDAIFCAQAFHWFNEERTRTEWRRILRPGSFAALVWNNIDAGDEFSREYMEVLFAYGTGSRETMSAALATQQDNVLFAGAPAGTAEYRHAQPLDLAGLIGRTASASYMPPRGDPRFPEVVERLTGIFARFQSGGRVQLVYRAVAEFGPIA